jgi:hypothetical protein
LVAPVVERLGPIGGGYLGLIGGTVGLNNIPPTIDLYGRCLVLVVEVEDVTGAIDGLLDPCLLNRISSSTYIMSCC